MRTKRDADLELLFLISQVLLDDNVFLMAKKPKYNSAGIKLVSYIITFYYMNSLPRGQKVSNKEHTKLVLVAHLFLLS